MDGNRDQNNEPGDESPQKEKYPKESAAKFLGLDQVNIWFLLATGIAITASYLFSFKSNDEIASITGVIVVFYWVIALTVLIIKWRSRE